MIRKNVANQTVYLPQLRLTADGSAVTAAASLVVAKDGVEAAAAGTLAHYAGGIWKYTPTQDETNCAIMALVLTATGADTVLLNILTTAANPQDATAFGIGNLDAAISSRMATYTQPTGFLTATFPTTVASPTNITSATGVVLASTTHTGAVIPTVTSVTNGVTVSTNNDKTGYSLVAGTGLGNQTANITGNLSGSVGSVTNRVTANTDQWNGVAVTGMPMPTFTLPANFSSLFITAGGYVVVSGDSFGNTLIIPNLASQSSVNTLIGYVDTEVAAIKAKTDNLPANPAAVSDIPTANQNRDAVFNAMPTAGWTNGSFGDRLLIGNTAQRNVAVTGAHHVAADMHEIQPGVITFNAFDTDAINLNAIDGAVYAAIANAVAATQALSRLDSMIESDGAGQFRFDTIALSMGAGGGGGAVNIVVEDRSITVE